MLGISGDLLSHPWVCRVQQGGAGGSCGHLGRGWSCRPSLGAPGLSQGLASGKVSKGRSVGAWLLIGCWHTWKLQIYKSIPPTSWVPHQGCRGRSMCPGVVGTGSGARSVSSGSWSPPLPRPLAPTCRCRSLFCTHVSPNTRPSSGDPPFLFGPSLPRS